MTEKYVPDEALIGELAEYLAVVAGPGGKAARALVCGWKMDRSRY